MTPLRRVHQRGADWGLGSRWLKHDCGELRRVRVSVDPEGHSGAWLCFCALGLGQRRILFRCWWTGRGGGGRAQGRQQRWGRWPGDTGVACCEDREPGHVPRAAGGGGSLWSRRPGWLGTVGFCLQRCRILVLAPWQADQGVSVGEALA